MQKVFRNLSDTNVRMGMADLLLFMMFYVPAVLARLRR